MHSDRKEKPSDLASATAGAISGSLAKTVIAPLDRAKINFQVSRTHRYSFKAALKFMQHTYTNNGFLALYRGHSATLIRVVPCAAFQFTAYERFKYLFRVDQGEKTPLRRLAAGSLCGGVATILTYPLDTARSLNVLWARLAVSTKQEFNGITDFFVNFLQRGDVLNMYRGLIPTLAGVVPLSGIVFFSCETLKLMYMERTGKGRTPAPYTAAFGAISGLIGQASTYPLDIVRRRMQTGNVHHGEGVIQLMQRIAREEGLVRLYKGFSMNLLKAPISTAVVFSSYQTTKEFMDKNLK